jgi:hypothetical protein
VNDLGEDDRKKLAEMPDPPKLISFAEAIRTRQQPGGNAEVSHRATTLLHLANIAIRMGRKIRWDPEAEQIVDDEQANRLVNIPMRSPWHLWPAARDDRILLGDQGRVGRQIGQV